MLIFFVVLSALTGVGIWATERVDRPMRRAARQVQAEAR